MNSSQHPSPGPPPGFAEAAPDAGRLTRAVCALLDGLGFATLTEFRLPNRRRADVIGLHASGDLVIVEVKSSLADYRADGKWREYLPYCDGYAFAVGPAFPRDILPQDVGIIATDGWQAAVLRDFQGAPLHAARRRALTLAFARIAALRLAGREDGAEAEAGGW